jgi:hypothetical protein
MPTPIAQHPGEQRREGGQVACLHPVVSGVPSALLGGAGVGRFWRIDYEAALKIDLKYAKAY